MTRDNNETNWAKPSILLVSISMLHIYKELVSFSKVHHVDAFTQIQFIFNTKKLLNEFVYWNKERKESIKKETKERKNWQFVLPNVTQKVRVSCVECVMSFRWNHKMHQTQAEYIQKWGGGGSLKMTFE